MASFDLPSVSDDDVVWSCKVLGLPPFAFGGLEGNDQRLAILRSTDTLDVEACPGSGKTTLLVAKLAILARHWRERRHGICVLSHTNVARLEIERRLGDTSAGRRLLSYPHFVGTIHGFVNEFLAMPWLRAKGFPLRRIDDEATLSFRWKSLSPTVRSALEKNGHDRTKLRVVDTQFGVGAVRWGKGGTLRQETPTYREMVRVCRATCEAGYFCFDEMFLWALELLEAVAGMPQGLRRRFPVLFLDEVQDNSEAQSALLFRLFSDGPNPVIRQRFGDSNQAIYGHAGPVVEVRTDPFPTPRCRRDIPNSHRFGPGIASIADGLAVRPQGLVGAGPSSSTITSDTNGMHAIFLFAEDLVSSVLARYAQYLTEVFTEVELREGTFTAVGAIHRSTGEGMAPRCVGHYWPSYEPTLTGLGARPDAFLKHIAVGRHRSQASGEVHFLVEEIAEGVLRVAGLANRSIVGLPRKRRHRHVLELLADDAVARRDYLEFIRMLVLTEDTPETAEWAKVWAPAVKRIAEAMSGRPTNSSDVQAFLGGGLLAKEERRGPQADNTYRFPSASPKVRVRVGSIHSVKGETHTATLVLETFHFKHNLSALKAWLVGDRKGVATGDGKGAVSRLRQHYVAMSRPSSPWLKARTDDLT